LGAIALCLAAMVIVLGLGVFRSNILAQPLWSEVLGRQAVYLFALAFVVTLVSVRGVPVGSLRGWPCLSAVVAISGVALCGAGAVLAAGLIAACCFVVGHAVFLITGVRERTDPLLCLVTGLGSVMLLLVTAGLSHLPMLGVFWLILSVSTALLLSRRLRHAACLSLAFPAGATTAWGLSRIACAWLMLFALLFYLGETALPERFWDPLAMHLLIPSQVLVFGHWGYDPTQFAFAFFPLAADYLFTFGLALGGEGAVKLINLLALVAILLLLVDIVRPFCGTLYAELGILLLLSLPVALLCTASAMVENLLCLLILGAVRALLLMDETPQRAPLIALCVLLPAMAAVKLHGAVAALPCAAMAMMRLEYRALGRSGWLMLIATGLTTGALGLSQYAYAWYDTGNPVFPMMNDVFRSPLWPTTAFEDLRWQGHLTWDLLYQMTFHSDAFMECLAGAMGFVFIALLLPGIVATLLIPRKEPIVALAVAVTYLAAVLPQVQYIRYLYPVMPLLIVPCMHGLAVIGTRVWGRVAGGAIAGVGVILGLYVLPSGGWILRDADLRAGYDPAARHAMLANQVPTRLATEAINAIGSGLPRVIYGGEPYGALLRGTPIYTNWYNRTIQAAIAGPADMEAVTAALDSQRPDYVVAQPETKDPAERRIVAYAERRGARVATIGNVALWRIVPVR
jgi:hypothetical protein